MKAIDIEQELLAKFSNSEKLDVLEESTEVVEKDSTTEGTDILSLDDVDKILGKESVEKEVVDVESDSTSPSYSELEVLTLDEIEELEKNKKITVESENDEDAPFWNSLEEFNNIVEEYGIPGDSLKPLLEKVSDSGRVEQQKLINNLLRDKKNLEDDLKAQRELLIRADDVTSLANFDNLETTQRDYIIPLGAASTEVSKIFDRENIKLSVRDVLGINNRTDLTSLLSETSLDEVDTKRVYEHWRTYQDTLSSYVKAKSIAKQKLKDLTTNVLSDDQANTIYKRALHLLLDQDEYKYIEEGIKNKSKEALDLINKSGDNFDAFISGMRNGASSLTDVKYLTAFAKYFVESEHAFRQADKVKSLKDELDFTKAQLEKVANAYKKLLGDAKSTSTRRVKESVPSRYESNRKDVSGRAEEKNKDKGYINIGRELLKQFGY